MTTIKIGKKSGMGYFPKNIRKEGFEGSVDTIFGVLTLTLVKPGVSTESVIKSLKLVLKDLELRTELKKQMAKGR